MSCNTDRIIRALVVHGTALASTEFTEQPWHAPPHALPSLMWPQRHTSGLFLLLGDKQ